MTQRVVRPQHCCPELWVPHPWRCPKPWVGPGQPELAWGTQPMGGVGLGALGVPSNPTIPWFYGSVILKVPSNPTILWSCDLQGPFQSYYPTVLSFPIIPLPVFCISLLRCVSLCLHVLFSIKELEGHSKTRHLGVYLCIHSSILSSLPFLIHIM